MRHVLTTIKAVILAVFTGGESVNSASGVYDNIQLSELIDERVRYLTMFLILMFLLLAVTVTLLVRNVKLRKKLQEAVNIDMLTGVYSRRFFMEVAALHIERSKRMGTNCYLVIFDLDHFKTVNDTYRHTGGDKALTDIAQRVKNIIRPYDVIGRYGGEEFIILMSDIEGVRMYDVMAAADRIRLEIFNTPVEYEGNQIFISASFGVACAAPENDLDITIRHADEALYRAKDNGRNRVVFYED